jgi:EmrB/QacA subfamily drug resistance transporter
MTATTESRPGPADVGEPPPYPLRWIGLCVVLAADAVDLLDSTIVGVASPSIHADFGGSSTQIQWISAAYTLALAVLMITGARLGDILGRRRMFVIGSAGFAVCSALCAAATGPGMLIAARAAQGAFAAMMVPQGMGIVREMFPPAQLGVALSAFGPVMGLSAVAGPVLGGFLTDADLFGTGWRMVFLVNVPLAAAAAIAAGRVVPDGRAARPPRLDLTGVALISAATLLLLFPLVQGRDLGWPWWCHACMAASVPVLALFALHLRRVRARGGSPLVEPGLFRNRAFTSALVVGTVFFAAMSGLMLVVTLHLQLGLGFSAQHCGDTMIPWSLGTVAGAIVGGQVLGPRLGRHTIHAGLAVVVVSVLGLAETVRLAGGTPSSWQLAPALAAGGVGMGMLMSPFFRIALADLRKEEVGSASGTLNAVQQLGSSIGVAVLGTLFFDLGGSPGARAAEWTMVVTAAAFVVAFGMVFLLPRQGRPAETGAETEAPAPETGTVAEAGA